MNAQDRLFDMIEANRPPLDPDSESELGEDDAAEVRQRNRLTHGTAIESR